MIKRCGITVLSAFALSMNAMAAEDADLAHIRALDCFNEAADYFVRNTNEAADLIVPAVIARCKMEVDEWIHNLSIDINRTQNIMMETPIAVTEAQVAEEFRVSLPNRILTTIVEARARVNATQ